MTSSNARALVDGVIANVVIYTFPDDLAAIRKWINDNVIAIFAVEPETKEALIWLDLTFGVIGAMQMKARVLCQDGYLPVVHSIVLDRQDLFTRNGLCLNNILEKVLLSDIPDAMIDDKCREFYFTHKIYDEYGQSKRERWAGGNLTESPQLHVLAELVTVLWHFGWQVWTYPRISMPASVHNGYLDYPLDKKELVADFSALDWLLYKPLFDWSATEAALRIGMSNPDIVNSWSIAGK